MLAGTTIPLIVKYSQVYFMSSVAIGPSTICKDQLQEKVVGLQIYILVLSILIPVYKCQDADLQFNKEQPSVEDGNPPVLPIAMIHCTQLGGESFKYNIKL